ncbi:rel-like DNA-binding domain-containing protein [Phthorimaea operculella]|nr:rel-like DNA-binding domain-containing protein [Phthorimaea operculella]
MYSFINSSTNMLEKEDSSSSISTPGSSPFQQVPAADPLPRDTLLDKSLHSSRDKPYLIITVQPQEQFRFRYVKEITDSSHGYLQGESPPNAGKTFPTVELSNYNGEAVIKCQVYQHDKDIEHPHRLFYGSIDIQPIVNVSAAKGYTVPFECLGIIHTAKGEQEKQLLNRLERELEREEFQRVNKKMLVKLRNEIDSERVRLRFSAHDPVTDKELCSVYSRIIYHKKIQICRSSHFSGRASGGDEVMLFVEKVNKDIVVNFFEENSVGVRVWDGKASVIQMHHGHGICIRTPQYTYKKEEEMTKPADVFMELVDNHGRRSDPVRFRYKPEPHHLLRKRARLCTTTYEINEGPKVIPIVQTAEPVLVLPLDGMVANNSDLGVQSAAEFFRTFDITEAVEMNKTVEEISDVFNRAPSVDLPAFNKFLNDDLPDLIDKYPLLTEEDVFMGANSLVSDKPGPGNSQTPVVLRACGDDRGQHSEVEDDDNEEAPLLAEDLLEIQTLLKDILSLKEKKLREWHKEVTEMLESLFEMRMANGDTILHVLLNNNEAALSALAELCKKLDRPDLLNVQRTKDGLTALHIAAATQRAELQATLIQQGCDPLCGDWSGNNAIHYAVLCQSPILEQLLDAIFEQCGRDKAKMDWMLRQTNYDFQTPLWLAVDRQSPKSVELLLQYYDCEKDLEECQGRSPLQLAVEHQNPDILKILLQVIPRMGTLSRRSRLTMSEACYLQLAVEHQDPDILNMLLRVTPSGAACLNACLRAARSMPPSAHTEENVAMLLNHGSDPVLADINAHSESDSDDDYYSADEGDSDASEDDIGKKLQAMNLNYQS